MVKTILVCDSILVYWCIMLALSASETLLMLTIITLLSLECLKSNMHRGGWSENIRPSSLDAAKRGSHKAKYRIDEVVR